MSRQCFILSQADAALGVGETATLTGAEAKHAKVKRVEAGEELDLVDGHGTRYVVSVLGQRDQVLETRVLAMTSEAAPGLPLTLVQALSKQDRDLQAVETCVEIGIDAVQPWQADRSIVRWKGERAAKAQQKWEAVVLAALKQSRRAWLPTVHPVADTAGLAEAVAQRREAGGLTLVLHEETEDSLPSALAAWRADAGVDAAGVALIVGPEGGISPRELDVLRSAGAVAVGLGPNVLRASTAGAVAAVLVKAAAGDYGSAPAPAQ